MTIQLIANLAFLSPLVFLFTALASWFQPGLRPTLVKKVATASTLIGMCIAAISGYFVFKYGLLESTFIGYSGLGFSLRLDAVSALMFGMITLLSFIIVRFSQNYLDGDARQGAFIGRLSTTIAAVQLLVLSGNLGLLFVSWVFTSMSLHQLLIFYRERPGAIIAARKKFVVARLGDVCLLAALAILFLHFGTGNLEAIFQQIQTTPVTENTSTSIEIAALLLASAAMLKSAQFPVHGWLIEVMETPTPVSALLHAGLLNAGPFLIIRMAYVMQASTIAPLMLIALGAFTAIFASVVFLTQTSIKTALGYSSVAHMGFSLFACGMGVYPAAMLHLVAHSFYKAHSFLSSGSVIDVIRATKITATKRIGNPFRIALGILLGLGVYTGFALIWGITPTNEMALYAIGAIIVLGLSRLFTSAIDSFGSFKLVLRAALFCLLITTAFFTLEAGTHFLLASQLPEIVPPGFGTVVLLISITLAFALVVFIQIIAPSMRPTPFYSALAVHFRNGLYVNTLFDTIVRAFYTYGSEKKPAIIHSTIHFEQNMFGKTVQQKSETATSEKEIQNLICRN